MQSPEIVKKQKFIYYSPFLAKKSKEFVLWFFTGTQCNLTCTQCYVESSPTNNSIPYLTYETFEKYLNEAHQQDFNKLDIYFTGGEPFLNPDILKMLDKALDYGDTTVLTNGTKFNDKLINKLDQKISSKKYKLIFRISLDGTTAEQHDAFRGKGTFEKTLKGIKKVSEKNYKTIITTFRSWKKYETKNVEEEFIDLLVDNNIPSKNQNLKVLSPIRIGREEKRHRGYVESELFNEFSFNNFNFENLQCLKCRMITEKGVWVCPILVNESGGKMGDSLAETFKPYPLKYAACWTCRNDGLTCEN